MDIVYRDLQFFQRYYFRHFLPHVYCSLIPNEPLSNEVPSITNSMEQNPDITKYNRPLYIKNTFTQSLLLAVKLFKSKEGKYEEGEGGGLIQNMNTFWVRSLHQTHFNSKL